VHLARIATSAGRIHDVFYVRDEEGRKIADRSVWGFCARPCGRGAAQLGHRADGEPGEASRPGAAPPRPAHPGGPRGQPGGRTAEAPARRPGSKPSTRPAESGMSAQATGPLADRPRATPMPKERP
jgi:hypothetical protein